MWLLFSSRSPYKTKAKSAAFVWTLLILFACFIPGKEIPDLHMPLADKWTHFILFGVFTLLCMLSNPTLHWRRLLRVFLAGCILGWLVEELQGLLSFLGRSKDMMDMLADALGALLGIMLFYIFARIAARKETIAKTSE